MLLSLWTGQSVLFFFEKFVIYFNKQRFITQFVSIVLVSLVVVGHHHVVLTGTAESIIPEQQRWTQVLLKFTLFTSFVSSKNVLIQASQM